MLLIVALSLISAAVFAAAGQALRVWFGLPDTSYAGAVPWFAAWILAPLAIILLIVSAIEFAVRKKSVALKWAVGFISLFAGAWAGNAAATGVRRVFGI